MSMTEGPFDHHFARSVAGSSAHRPLGMRVLLLALVPPAIIALALAIRPAPAHAVTKPRPGFEAVLPSDPPPNPASGSIFNVNAGYAGLVEGTRAHTVGDAVMIVLVENFNSSKSATGKTQKSGSFAFTPPTKGPLSLLSSNALNSSGAAAFNGQGNASQTSTLGGNIAVTIAEVRRNGTALVKGEKHLLLSQGDEWVQFSGIIRLADVDQYNQIQSSQVADARMIYTGNGSILRASREGWLAKFFSFVNPF